jgi:hypothetical protein
MVDVQGYLTRYGPVSLIKGIEKFYPALAMLADGDPPAVEAKELAFKFGRMFSPTAFKPSIDGLKELGAAMYKYEIKDKTDTPAGYTFLGQFIDHDMSFDEQRSGFPGSEGCPTYISRRSPALDLDSLYGRFRTPGGTIEYDKKLYEDDEIRFRLGYTEAAVVAAGYPNDLPRECAIIYDPKPRAYRRAITADERSDENLGLAQTVVAFLRFHNAVVEFLRDKVPASELFQRARHLVIRHYQWIILNDFLPRIVDPKILAEVIGWAKTGNPALNWQKKEPNPFVPVEFAGAAFRLGHSLLQGEYDWNTFFGLPHHKPAGFFSLFEFTGIRSIETQLRGDWVIDWRRFYDFSCYGIKPPAGLNTSGVIDPILIINLSDIPGLPDVPPEAANLAILNLCRGEYLKLPTGQEVVEEMSKNGKLDGKPLLTPAQVAAGEHETIIKNNCFDENTPLWYYILKEAQQFGKNGFHLGTVGSHIVAETFVLLILRSDVSILKTNWNPQQEEFPIAPKGRPNDFRMPDLIAFAHTEKHPLIYGPGEKLP